MTEHVMLDGKITLKCGDCLESLRAMPDCSVDSCVTDPPYHLTSIVKRFGGQNAAPAQHGTDGAYARASKGFMNKTWDGGDITFRVELWAEVWRVLKPGGWVAAFSATRTYHRMACAIEDAGFEIRDDILNMVASDTAAQNFMASLSRGQIDAFLRLMEDRQWGGMAGWAYGSGFPKSHDVSKAIDKAAGIWRGRAGAVKDETVGQVAKGTEYERTEKGEPATPQAAAWQGWGTALKPAWEPICMARKPLAGTVAENVLEHGTGALNIDGCRVGSEGGTRFPRAADKSQTDSVGGYLNARAGEPIDAGRWPANIVHDGSDEVVAAFPEAPGQQRAVGPQFGNKDSVNVFGDYGPRQDFTPRNDSGSAARFFYSAKADKQDRIGSKHPTVKPVDLMQWLCRLVTPPGGTVLDPFAGSGSTGEAAWREGFKAILCEREEEYQADIQERMRLANAGPMERRARAIKQSASAGPLFGDNDNNPNGGADRSTASSRISNPDTGGGIMAGKGGFGFRIREQRERGAA